MAIANGNVIAAADLNTSADGKRTVINTVSTTTHGLRISTETSAYVTGSQPVTNSVVFTPQDNYELISLWLYVHTSSSAVAYSATLSVASSETEFILDDTVTVTGTGTGGEDHFTADFAATTATRYVLRKGVAYKLVITGADNALFLQGVATFKLKRRPK